MKDSTTTQEFAYLYEMHVGEVFEPNASCEVRRVPGGWLWIEKVVMKGGQPFSLAPTFVPYYEPTPET